MVRPVTVRGAMEAQGYESTRKCCGNCKHYIDGRGFTLASKTLYPNNPEKWVRDFKGQRCGIGNFGVRPAGICRLYEKNPNEAP
jgi:hypothetical protein